MFALAVLPKLAEIGVAVLEQPLPGNRLGGYKRLKLQAALPIIMDENIVNSTELEEFIELHNPGDAELDLSGWILSDAVAFTFPAGTKLDLFDGLKTLHVTVSKQVLGPPMMLVDVDAGQAGEVSAAAFLDSEVVVSRMN